MKDLTLYTKIESLPKDLKKEVIDFIDFLTHKLSKEKPVSIPKFGSAKGKIKLSADFDEPLDELKNTKYKEKASTPALSGRRGRQNA